MTLSPQEGLRLSFALRLHRGLAAGINDLYAHSKVPFCRRSPHVGRNQAWRLTVLEVRWVWHSSTTHRCPSGEIHASAWIKGEAIPWHISGCAQLWALYFFAWSSFTKSTAAPSVVKWSVLRGFVKVTERFANVWWNSANILYTLNFTVTAVNICWSILGKKYLAKNLAIKLGNHSNSSPSG